MEKTRPKIGIGVYVMDGRGNILMMLRTNSHGEGTWSPPGGHLEMGESFLDCCKRELTEETSLKLEDIEFLGVVNNIFSPEKHYVNVDFVAKGVSGTPVICEPNKCTQIGWYPIDKLPQPQFLANANLFKTRPEIVEKLRNFNSLKS